MFLLLTPWLGRVAGLAAAATGVCLLIHPGTPLQRLPSAALSGLGDELRGAARLVTDPARLAGAEAAMLTAVPKLPGNASGTADIYSTGQTQLFATSLVWAPRPVPQSYSAYTPDLAALDVAHLLGPGAPDNIFFMPEPVDDRLAALEDGPSWPALLSLYDPVLYDGPTGLALLRRNTAAQPVSPGSPILRINAHINRTVALPAGGLPLWARIDPRPSILGRLAGMAWRPPQLTLRIDFASGRSKRFRLIPGMARAGFLLSPVVTTTLDFLHLRGPDGGTPAGFDRPVSIAVLAQGAGALGWRNHYALTLANISFPKLPAPFAMQGVGVPAEQAGIMPAGPARCFIDEIDGGAVPGEMVQVGFPIRLNGWAVFDGAGHLGAEAIDIGFQSAGGQVFTVPTTPLWRTDVAPVFHLPAPQGIGFTVEADVTRLPPGGYAVLALPKRGGVARGCPTGLKIVR